MESMKYLSWRRRQRNGLLDDFHGKGIDVGAGKDHAPWWDLAEFRGRGLDVWPWDMVDGDAHHLEGVENRTMDFLFASHILEHLEDPVLALRNWVRVVRPGGVLLIAVPHRDLYERKLELPSRWNRNHKRFYLPNHSEPPHTVGLLPFLDTWAEELHFNILAVQTGDWGYKPVAPDQHAVGEYQIDALLHRRP
jgi:SAM-dependent methyltransferase